MAKQAWTFMDGSWLEGNPGLLGPLSHAMWLSSIVFDGARAFEGVTPDLDLHCERVVRSARALGLEPMLSAGEIHGIAVDGVRRFAPGSALYIRPMFWAEHGFGVDPDPESTRFAFAIYESPLPQPGSGSACVVGRRRPSAETAPTLAKASCLYPQAALAIREAKARGFDNAVMLDPLGNVAEFANANLFLAKDGTVVTPVCNGTFLNGITRQRVIALLRADGVAVEERAVRPEELLDADEIFSSGNYANVLPVTRIDDRDLQPGPLYARARRLYWEYAHS